MLHNATTTRNAKSYRRCRSQAAVGEPGSLRQTLAALSAFLDLQSDERLTGVARERRWLVVHALATDQAIETSSVEVDQPKH